MLLLPSYVHLECPDSEPRRGPSTRQPDEVLAADVAGEQGGADLFGGTKVNSASPDHYSVEFMLLTGSQNMCLPARKKPLTVSLFFLNID